MREYILNKAKEQLAIDYNCNVEDFDNNENIITNLNITKECRKDTEDKEILKILIINGKAVICSDECIKDWCIKELSNFPAEWMFLYSVLRRIDRKLNEFGYEIDNTHHYYLPKDSELQGDKDFKLKWYEKDEILQFKEDNRFDEAFAFNSNYSDVLGVAALDDKGNILGMAGASEDSNIMWQIGINVLPEAKGRGISIKLVQVLKNEVLRRGKIPFYGTIESHIISQKVALKAGFYPVFAEIKIRKINQ